MIKVPVGEKDPPPGFKGQKSPGPIGLMLAALGNRDKYHQEISASNRPNTRAKVKGDIPHPNIKGHLGKTTSSATDTMWNKIPMDIRDNPSFEEASRSIVRLFNKPPSQHLTPISQKY